MKTTVKTTNGETDAKAITPTPAETLRTVTIKAVTTATRKTISNATAACMLVVGGRFSGDIGFLQIRRDSAK
jgi:hypothetical protein